MNGFEGLLLNIDPNSTSLLGFVLAGVTSIISVLFGMMIKARNEQLKEKEATIERIQKLHNEIITAKNDDILYKAELYMEARKENNELKESNLKLLSQVFPALKTTQEILKELSAALREIQLK